MRACSQWRDVLEEENCDVEYSQSRSKSRYFPLEMNSFPSPLADRDLYIAGVQSLCRVYPQSFRLHETFLNFPAIAIKFR